MKTIEILKESSEPFDKERYIRFMKKCGYDTIFEQVQGEKANGSPSYKKVWTLKKHKGCKGASYVTLAFIHDTDKLRLSYPHPYDSKEIRQIFDFDVNVFLYAYEEEKQRRLFPSDFFMPFNQLFFDLNYPKANWTVKFIFQVFSITPTIVRRCIRQNKGMKRKIDLEVKNSQYFAFLGLERKIIRVGSKNIEKTAKIDVEKEQIAKTNMKAAIKNAALKYDLNYFKDFLNAFALLQNAQKIYAPISKRKEQILFEKFVQDVKQFQRENKL